MRASLKWAANHARKVARSGSSFPDPGAEDLADWLEDLLVLRKEVRDWAEYSDGEFAPDESLLEVLQGLKGRYDDEDE